MESRLDKEYKEWLEKQEIPSLNGWSTSSDKIVKEAIIADLSFVSRMSVEEYTLYRKWREIQEKYPVREEQDDGVDLFFDVEKSSFDVKNTYPEIQAVKDKIWRPESPEDYKKLEPVLLWTGRNKELTPIWNILRTLTSTMLNNPNIGRNLYFVCVDRLTEKYLGVICCSSDFMDLTPRDNYIGWSREIKTTRKMINHTTIGSTIVPTQPLGFSFVGGKLLALLTISNITEEAWNERYKDKLAGYTTTSLYGSFSQYQNLKYWTKRGHSAGSIKFEPSKSTIYIIREWLKAKCSRRYWEWYYAKNNYGLPLKRDHKQRSLSFAYRQLGIPRELIETNHGRGIYFCPLFTNTCEYLRMEVSEDKLVRRFDNNYQALSDIWKERYAKKRVENLLKDGRYNTHGLFYDDMIGTEWGDIKEKYIEEVGR